MGHGTIWDMGQIGTWGKLGLGQIGIDIVKISLQELKDNSVEDGYRMLRNGTECGCFGSLHDVYVYYSAQAFNVYIKG